ncbi:hypothetical protein FACS18942_02590 [Planctomycetales bacterium]|nr:hypothetical protein FACS18942_02590 [Planctomycetales bacterium]GHT36313.1 hypothetical protein FACS189427_07680 [Planctomycetales bacterium]
MSTQVLPSVDALFSDIVRLPQEQRAELFIRLQKNGVQLTPEPFDEEDDWNEVPSTNPDNPSPSGDPWFDNPQNMMILEEAVRDIEDMKSGRTQGIVLKSKEDIRNFFAGL